MPKGKKTSVKKLQKSQKSLSTKMLPSKLFVPLLFSAFILFSALIYFLFFSSQNIVDVFYTDLPRHRELPNPRWKIGGNVDDSNIKVAPTKRVTPTPKPIQTAPEYKTIYTVSGKVNDVNGLPVTNYKLKVVDATGRVFTSFTDKSGVYRISVDNKFVDKRSENPSIYSVSSSDLSSKGSLVASNFNLGYCNSNDSKSLKNSYVCQRADEMKNKNLNCGYFGSCDFILVK